MRLKAKYILWSISSITLLALTGEIVARYYFGLGTPALSISQPTIEYMYKPNQDIYRFGKHFMINQYAMRSDPFPIHKDANELRIMVFGDSVVNGGNLTDQSELATTILKEKLAKLVNQNAIKNVVIGNISAGSWGPGNWLAYAREYGFFDADIVVLVISSHDYIDNPTFAPLNPNTHPTAPPISALLEGIERYVPRHLPQISSNSSITEADRFPTEAEEKEVQKALNDLQKFLKLAKNSSKTVLVFQHYTRSEIESGHAEVGNARIKIACEEIGIIPTSLEPYFRRSLESGNSPYRDNIHPNKVGQMLLSEAIFDKMPKNFLK